MANKEFFLKQIIIFILFIYCFPIEAEFPYLGRGVGSQGLIRKNQPSVSNFFNEDPLAQGQLGPQMMDNRVHLDTNLNMHGADASHIHRKSRQSVTGRGFVHRSHFEPAVSSAPTQPGQIQLS